MKRIITAFLAVLMIGTAALATVSAATNKVDGRLTAEAYIADIKVDGQIEAAWNDATVYNIERVKTVSDTTFYKTTMKPGKDFASMTFKVLWDGKATMYILIEVYDITPNLTGDKDQYKDCVEIFYNKDNDSTPGAKKTNQFRILADGTQNTSKKITCGYSKTKTGYVIEAALDVSSSRGAGMYIGLDFQLADNALGNGGIAEVYMGWSDVDNKASSDASVYGQCLLSTKKLSEVKAAQTTAATTKAQTTAATTKAPAVKPAAPATFDAAVIIAVVAAASGAGVVVSKKRK